MKLRILVQAFCVVFAMAAFSAPSFSAGDGGGGGSGGSSGGSSGGGSSSGGSAGGGGGAGGGGSKSVSDGCKKGKVYSKKLKKCVTASSALDNDTLYEAGRDLAMEGRYGEAITILTMASDKTDPRVLNYLGYSHRKQGRVLVGLGYYEEALRNDPDYTLAREYMGEAYLQLGDLSSARNQLDEIQKRCGTTCREFTLLDAQIEAYAKGGDI